MYQGKPYTAHEDFSRVEFSHEGESVVSGSGFGLAQWRVADGGLLRRWDEPAGVAAFALCPSSQRAALITRGGSLKVLRLADGVTLWRTAAPMARLFNGHLYGSQADVVFFRDERIAVCAGGEVVTIYRARDGLPLQQLRSPLGGVRRLSIDAAGNQLIAVCDGGVLAWR